MRNMNVMKTPVDRITDNICQTAVDSEEYTLTGTAPNYEYMLAPQHGTKLRVYASSTTRHQITSTAYPYGMLAPQVAPPGW